MKYRKGIGIFLINSEKKIWVGKRIDNKNNYWQMPQGGIDKDETEEQAMKREMFEEVGINDNYEILGTSNKLLSYDLPKEIIKFVWNGKYIGQSQRWFFCKFIGIDSMFDLEKDDNPEFYKWKWVKPSECISEVVPFKRSLYGEVLQEYKKLEI